MTKDMAHRFLNPKSPRRRRYEALRTRFVKRCPIEEAPRRIGHSRGSFRNLCSQFVNAEDPGFPFPTPATDTAAKPQPVPTRGKLRSVSAESASIALSTKAARSGGAASRAIRNPPDAFRDPGAMPLNAASPPRRPRPTISAPVASPETSRETNAAFPRQSAQAGPRA